MSTKPKLKVGDIIDCTDINGDYTGLARVARLDDDGNPLIIERADNHGWPRDGKIPSGYVEKYGGCYWHTGSDSDPNHWKIVTPPEKKKLKPVDVHVAFDRLIIEQIAKDEIIAVLKQHSNATKMFDDWGIGDVITYGKGMTFLFYGNPGTGKTFAAHCMAAATGKELLVLSAAEVQSAEPGAANRNIIKAFRRAKEEDKILFMDECDSLITCRSTVGMILGSEINTLLTEIEKYEGILVLATNRADTLDAALERRISLIIEFKEPTAAERVAIWQKMLPKKMPITDEVTAEKLAEYKLTGGQIKNVLLQAARLALAEKAEKVELRHFEIAIDRINKSKSLLGSSSSFSDRVRRDLGVGVVRSSP